MPLSHPTQRLELVMQIIALTREIGGLVLSGSKSDQGLIEWIERLGLTVGDGVWLNIGGAGHYRLLLEEPAKTLVERRRRLIFDEFRVRQTIRICLRRSGSSTGGFFIR
jgi:hypothetical protein